jgi:hypothetical protein
MINIYLLELGGDYLVDYLINCHQGFLFFNFVMLKICQNFTQKNSKIIWKNTIKTKKKSQKFPQYFLER